MSQMSDVLMGIANKQVKIGEIRIFCGSNIPTKWMLCNGSVINRSTYSQLFSSLGTTWGGGDGETTFAIPNMNGRNIIGTGESAATGHTAHTLGQMDGEETHVLSSSELASHNHWTSNGTAYIGLGGSNHHECCANRWWPNDGWNTNPMGSRGSNTAHNTMQPYLVTNYIIYTGVDTI